MLCEFSTAHSIRLILSNEVVFALIPVASVDRQRHHQAELIWLHLISYKCLAVIPCQCGYIEDLVCPPATIRCGFLQLFLNRTFCELGAPYPCFEQNNYNSTTVVQNIEDDLYCSQLNISHCFLELPLLPFCPRFSSSGQRPGYFRLC